MNAPLPLGSIADERAARLRSRATEGAGSTQVFEDALAEFGDKRLAATARSAFAFASRIEYDHAGLSSAAYLAHPVHVAALVVKLDPRADADTVVLALLHNVFEVSRVEPAEITARFGEHMASAIRALTVDRTATTHEYKVGYYRNLGAQPRLVRVVKVLDKLDNLFILGLNPDAKVRAEYLSDIEEFIVPMVEETLPHIAEYVESLIADSRAVGFIDGTHH